ncbi:hypothetical protein DAPPUDRAFT_255451 [Daphnia pulex]|uniref:Uncharacterized protein n=1 Tax=Daphnia pulex TaxID=6669 RepID=E9H975_DAPPU|nr:hypothetical protein DAPPUDRAFT_255451 [Daphnia pulex]|eukprot:EFX71746.1 hypothetical protein DAPPUDRAFT_255451 [Daphnia pulex]
MYNNLNKRENSNLTRYLSEQDQSDLEVDQIQDDDMYGDQAGAVTEEEMEDVLKEGQHASHYTMI